MPRRFAVLCACWLSAFAPLTFSQDVDAELPLSDDEMQVLVADLMAEVVSLRGRVVELEGRLQDGDAVGAALERLAKRESTGAPAHGMNVYYKQGLRFEAADGSFKSKLGGRVHWDVTTGSADSDLEDSLGDIEDGSEIRRARLAYSGSIYDQFEFKTQYDFAGGDADFKDVYMRFKQVPVLQNVTVGQFKEPMGLDEMTSSNVQPFVESNLAVALVPARSVGIGVSGKTDDKNLGWAAGWFKDDDGFGESEGGDGDSAVTARVFGTPIYEDEGRRVLHLGVSGSRRSPSDDMVRYSARPEAHQVQKFVDTGDFESDEVNLFGIELAGIEGPFHYQFEYTRAENDTPDGDADFSGNSIQIGYFLTGEHRGYNHGSGSFGRVAVIDPALTAEPGWGPGAWELALRKSHLDLDDGPIAGGTLDDWTLGLNWYLDPLTRVMLDYIRADLEGEGDADLAVLRVQREF